MSSNRRAFGTIVRCPRTMAKRIEMAVARIIGRDFIPIVKLDTDYTANGFRYMGRSEKRVTLSPYIEIQDYPLEIVKFDGQEEITLRFVVSSGNSATSPTARGNIRAVGQHGVCVVSQSVINIRYGGRIRYRLRNVGVQAGAYVDFFANDDDSRQSIVHCGRVMIEPEAAAPKGFYYASDGTLLGRIGTDTDPTDVFLVNNSVTQREAKNLITAINRGENRSRELINISTAVGMKNEELNLRAFLTVIRVAENSSTTQVSDTPLAYNIRYGNFVFDDFSRHPNIVFSGPGFRYPSEAAGAYQIRYESWRTINRIERQPDFSPTSQDRGAIILIEEQEIWNPGRARGVIQDIKSGNVESAAVKLNRTWAALPKNPREAKISIEDARRIFNESIARELAGESVIATPQGQLRFKRF